MKKFIAMGIGLAIAGYFAFTYWSPVVPDTIYYNGNIMTLDRHESFAKAVSIKTENF